ncbi:MAG: MFS transporter [Chloroflexi bacterium]|nr:MFS transporter [Chloroflexota bacterium]MCY4247730.1 MFS transporter [Chloroflexota bacterium]
MNLAKTFPILVAYLVFIIVGIASGLLNIAWTYMQATFGVSHDSLAALAPAAMLGGLVAAFLNGALLGRFSLGVVLVGGIAFAGFGLLGYAIAPVWLLLLATALFTSVGKGTIDAGLNNFVGANYGASEMNWLHACWGIGLTIAPAVVTFFVLDQGSGWQASYLVVGAAVLLLGGLILATLPLWQLRDSARPGGQTAKRQPMSASLRRPIVLVGMLFFFVYGGIEIGAGQLANTLLTEARALPQEVASSWVSAYWGSFTVGRILMGLLAMRLGDRLLLTMCFACSVAGAALLFFNLNEALSFVGMLGIGFGLAAIFPILISQTYARVGGEHAANAIGFQVGFAGLGGATLSGLGGIFAEYVGAESISLFIFAGAALAVIIYAFMLRFEAQMPRAEWRPG